MFDMAWISDPTAWLGLATLVVIEIVLGIDNLVFLAILCTKLPERQRDRARYIGLGGALIIRLLLLSLISYITNMVQPLFTLGSFGVSGRDLILMGGGVFLLYKATTELHSKLEGFDEELSASKVAAESFFLVVMQIMVLDAVFSLDAIITAVGMIDHVFIMMFAVIIAMGVMVMASKAITSFISQHPTLVILCLGFLLLIGFSLIVEALHFHVPKGYLYAAIGFSILIEAFNQIARRNTLRMGTASGRGPTAMQSREIAANLVLRLLGSNRHQVQTLKEAIVSAPGTEGVFNAEEQDMVSRVLQLSSLPIKAVMTARTDLEMIRVSDSKSELIRQIRSIRHSRVVAYREGARDQPLGYIRRSDVLALGLSSTERADLAALIREPLYLPETVSVTKALEEFRRGKHNIAFIIDEFGNFEGAATLHDIMEEITGEFPEPSESAEITRGEDGSWQVAGEALLNDVERVTGCVVPASERYHTIAGFILDHLQRLPHPGELIALEGWQLEVTEVDQVAVNRVCLRAAAAAAEGTPAP